MNSRRERQVQHPFNTVAVYLHRRHHTLCELMKKFPKLFSSKSSHDTTHNPTHPLECLPLNLTLPSICASVRSAGHTHLVAKSSQEGPQGSATFFPWVMGAAMVTKPHGS